MKKQDARIYGLKQRSLIPLEERKQRSKEIFLKILPLLEKYSCIGCYVSIKDEVDTSFILNWCFENHKKLCVPKVVGNTLTFHMIESWSDLEEGSFHVLEPKSNESISVKNIDMMFVPLSAFDKYHNRCGYGKGYYDSILNDCSYKVGLAFSEQQVEQIECEPFDIPLDEIING